jgi:hypothetical protein
LDENEGGFDDAFAEEPFDVVWFELNGRSFEVLLMEELDNNLDDDDNDDDDDDIDDDDDDDDDMDDENVEMEGELIPVPFVKRNCCGCFCC